MATVKYASDSDELLLEQAAHPETGELRVRFQPQVWLPKLDDDDRSQGQYASWKGVSWIVQCENVKEAERLRKELRVFFQNFSK